MNKELANYEASEDWKRRAKIFKENKKYTCELCGNHILLEVVELFSRPNHPSWKNPEITRFAEAILEAEGDKDRLIHAHHKSYKHLGFESFGEIMVLCKPCHTLFHENTDHVSWEKALAKTKAKVNALLINIKNSPDGQKEFRLIDENLGLQMMADHGLIEWKPERCITDLDIEKNEMIDEFFSYAKDIYRTKEEYD